MPSSQPDSNASEPDQQPVLFEESVSLDDLVLQSQQQQEPDGAELPCAINGLTSGLSGGVLGYAFGFGATPTPISDKLPHRQAASMLFCSDGLLIAPCVASSRITRHQACVLPLHPVRRLLNNHVGGTAQSQRSRRIAAPGVGQPANRPDGSPQR